MRKNILGAACLAAAVVMAGPVATATADGPRAPINCAVSANPPSLAGPYVVAFGRWSCDNLAPADFARVHVDIQRWTGAGWERLHLARYTQHGLFSAMEFTSGARCTGSGRQVYRSRTFGYESRELFQYDTVSREVTLSC